MVKLGLGTKLDSITEERGGQAHRPGGTSTHTHTHTKVNKSAVRFWKEVGGER